MMRRHLTYLCFLLMVWLFQHAVLQGQTRALLLIDIQEFYFPGGSKALHEPEKAAVNAGVLLQHFRDEGDMVVHIRHMFEPGGDFYASVDPLDDEHVISKYTVNAFLHTGLDSLLRSNGIESLVICGMQTQMCVEAAVRAASDLNYDCILVEDACATRPIQYGTTIIEAEDVHLSTLATLQTYADIMTTSEFLIRESRE